MDEIYDPAAVEAAAQQHWRALDAYRSKEGDPRFPSRMFAASACLIGSLMSSGVGLAFMAAIAVELALDKRRRRFLLVLVAPAAAFFEWFLAYGAGFLNELESAFAEAFAQHASTGEQAVLAAVQRPIAVACISVKMGRPRWKDRPSWFLVAEQDRMIVPDTQRFMAERMKATVRSHPVDHTPIVTAPGVVVDIIRDAMCAATAVRTPGR